MAKGNWNPNVIKPKARCRLCGGVIREKRGDVFVRLNGINPAHQTCADKRGLNYSIGLAIVTCGLTPRVPDAATPPVEYDQFPSYLSALEKRSG